MRQAVKFVMGPIAIVLAVWGAGSIYNAIFVPYVSWLQGAFGIMCLAGAYAVYKVIFDSGKVPTQGTVPTHASFPIDRYRLHEPIREQAGLVEFSPIEYATMGRQFEGEKNYNAAAVLFLGRHWKVKLQTVNGRIFKIAPYLVLASEEEANPIAMQTLNFCIEQLGEPAEQKTGLFVWDTTDGNVVLQSGNTVEGSVIGLFLTSKLIRGFKLA